jgi:hypothetical protein
MSFGFTFCAKSRYDAHAKLRDAYAPLSIKVAIEGLINALPWPKQAPKQYGSVNADEAQKASPALIGVFVEASGHFEDDGSGQSWISTFKVLPLFE